MGLHSILLVNKESHIIKALERTFAEDYQIYTADSGDKALEVCKNNAIDMVISDRRMPDISGRELLEKISTHYQGTIRILVTGYSDLEATLKAVDKGEIQHYIAKSWNKEDAKITVKKAFDQYDLLQENKKLREINER